MLQLALPLLAYHKMPHGTLGRGHVTFLSQVSWDAPTCVWYRE